VVEACDIWGQQLRCQDAMTGRDWHVAGTVSQPASSCALILSTLVKLWVVKGFKK